MVCSSAASRLIASMAFWGARWPGGTVGVSVGVDDVLIHTPGGFDLGVLVGGEQRVEPGPLPVGEQFTTGVEGAAYVCAANNAHPPR